MQRIEKDLMDLRQKLASVKFFRLEMLKGKTCMKILVFMSL